MPPSDVDADIDALAARLLAVVSREMGRMRARRRRHPDEPMNAEHARKMVRALKEIRALCDLSEREA